MELKVIWSKFAESQLDEIYDYYYKNVSVKSAKKLLKGIINEPDRLINSALIGQEEELLKERKNHYRYLVYKNYKLIYFVDTNKGFIKIADVFDTRQNPSKMKRIK